MVVSSVGHRSRRRPSENPSIGPPGYTIVEELGRGGCATVFRGVCRASGAAVAVKRVEKEGPAYAVTDRLEGSKAQGDYESALREIAVLRALGKAPRRVCALREVAERKRVIWLVLDLAPGVPIGRAFMSLHGEFIGGKRIYSVRPTRVFQRLAANKDDFGCIFIQKVLRQILQGLLELTACGYIHGDIKPDNVMLEVSPTGPRVTLIDLGSAVRPGLEDSLLEAPAATLESVLMRKFNQPAALMERRVISSDAFGVNVLRPWARWYISGPTSYLPVYNLRCVENKRVFTGSDVATLVDAVPLKLPKSIPLTKTVNQALRTVHPVTVEDIQWMLDLIKRTTTLDENTNYAQFPKILARTGPRYPFSPYNYERLVDMCGDLWGSELTEQGPLPESSEGEKPSEEQLRRMDLDEYSWRVEDDQDKQDWDWLRLRNESF
ncbi:hypothetical protein Pmar_PMAR012408 [Perkinsus marinus ATCC 50983]|uniref:Protein kinase domain-containing protein n=1 Tax=Perkinsus marinus (strain ATCC 50983 / TXsc) TaxID=423536 RepID=C5K794_PERM5|nr:hypothetical protein Pmar_PMAR012408 [Perkinsus marinus ATCC 50983]EER19429.1 hypothetical protein Pmar_PMAR012408 [Perkinsus marinus ATCC 50983]|eukprot:XP_002787633.1 hypothetical protein Pmar_PMAR012408 [Perkinsus marinus ATCC 50983]